jgi:hypothetical protein
MLFSYEAGGTMVAAGTTTRIGSLKVATAKCAAVAMPVPT